jgi:hypothetical protein
MCSGNMTKTKALGAIISLTALILAITHSACKAMLSSAYFAMLCRSPLDFGISLVLAIVYSHTNDQSYLPAIALFILVLLSAILTFPLGWLALWLCGHFNQPWLILPGVLLNALLWCWLLVRLGRNTRRLQPEEPRT